MSLIKSNGCAAKVEDLQDASQVLDLWSGLLSSRFEIDGKPVKVLTACHPSRDILAVRINSALLTRNQLKLSLKFPYGKEDWRDAVDWDSPDRHITRKVTQGNQADFTRILDEDKYYVRVKWSVGGAVTTKSQHEYEFNQLNAQSLEIVFVFSPEKINNNIPAFKEVRQAAAENWQQFWKNGGAIDFSQCTDSRAKELERRVVLSQYLMAINCSGSRPPQETGLVYNSWFGKYHLEMHWWHAVHFALWDRLPLLERSLPWYESILPKAKAKAKAKAEEPAPAAEGEEAEELAEWQRMLQKLKEEVSEEDEG